MATDIFRLLFLNLLLLLSGFLTLDDLLFVWCIRIVTDRLAFNLHMIRNRLLNKNYLSLSFFFDFTLLWIFTRFSFHNSRLSLDFAWLLQLFRFRSLIWTQRSLFINRFWNHLRFVYYWVFCSLDWGWFLIFFLTCMGLFFLSLLFDSLWLLSF